MKTSTVTKNFTALVGSNFAVQALRFLTIALLARRLGNSLFGVYNYIILLVTYGVTLVEFGLKNLAIREISQGRGSRKLVQQILKVRAGLAFFAMLGVMALAHFAFHRADYVAPAFFVALSLFVDAFLVDFIVIAQERLVSQAVANVAQALFMYITVLFLVPDEGQILLVSQLYLLSHVLWVSLFYVTAKPTQMADHQEFKQNVLVTAWQGAPYLVAQFLGSLHFSMDLLLLGQFHFESWLGDYGAAWKILGVTLGVINAFVAAVQPRLARESHDLSSESLGRLVDHTTRIIWLFLAPTVIGCWLFGDELVLWFFGTHFLRTAELLKPLSLAMSFFCLGLAPMQALFISHQTGLMVRVVLINVLVSFVTVATLLVLNHPEWVPWGMCFVQAFYMFAAWRPFKSWGFITVEEAHSILLPVGIMIIPLALPLVSGVNVAPLIRFSLAALAYVFGLTLLKVWRRPAFAAVLGRG